MSEPVAVTLDKPADYAEWRAAARRLLSANVAPDRVGFRLAATSGDLFGTRPGRAARQPAPVTICVPQDFPRLAKAVICHSDNARFALLYRLLWRLQGERRLLDNAADVDVYKARRMAKAVRRDSHKMKAFVRFRRTESDVGEVFVAWFEPDHHIVERTAPFFARRFAGMRWSIVTPGRSAHWNGNALTFGDGANRRDCPDGDALEEHWRVYYSSIFNPARLKIRAMKAEMPTRYWRNLPESRLIPELTRSAQSAQRAAPAGTPPSVASARRLVAAQDGMNQEIVSSPQTLGALATGLQNCTRCGLCQHATAAVPGEGPADARLLIVGEQPGDREDLSGRPFVGPAGQVLDEALSEAGIDRDAVFLTNAVKHFKHETRGKRRLHQRPNVEEIEACRWWLGLELELVAPSVVVALGATATRALTGKPAKVADARGQPFTLSPETVGVATVHPAYLLRLQDKEKARAERAQFIDDLRGALRLVSAAG
ncbi:MAG: UdgX family uracil-DNA binding protein [Gammaproteobacteria bacterium]|nr:UdgX family uracil-DNA binding protein [Gammaproteobacteria bacterium]MBT8105157.1 UdgX family uracil-DNA binding protein [Gammaproteobacteria bacterium]NNK25171.1 UdgX family uracil-DNA binding protein [Woeseiaceae bacterium]